MNQSSLKKINECFLKLYKVIDKYHISLWKVFRDFDKEKSSTESKLTRT